MEAPYYVIPQQMEVKPQPLSKKDYLELAKFSGCFAGVFILLQVLGMLFEIFILEQRLLDPSQKSKVIWLIIFYVIKNAYAMVLLGTLFIMTKGLAKGMKIPSWIILIGQTTYSIIKIVNHWKAFKKPADPESMEGMFELLTAMGYIIEFVVFMNMIIPFMRAIGNPPTNTIYEQLQAKEEQEEKEKEEMYKQVVEGARLTQAH